MKRLCFALDLLDDAASIAAYEAHHRAVWPEVVLSIQKAGIISLEIYRVADRLFMIVDADDHFDPEKKASADAADGRIQEWEQLMWKYQRALPVARPGEKWVPMHRIFDLRNE